MARQSNVSNLHVSYTTSTTHSKSSISAMSPMWKYGVRSSWESCQILNRDSHHLHHTLMSFHDDMKSGGMIPGHDEPHII